MCHWVKILQLANTVAEKVNYTQGDVSIYRSDSKREWSRSLVIGSQNSQQGIAETACTALGTCPGQRNPACGILTWSLKPICGHVLKTNVAI